MQRLHANLCTHCEEGRFDQGSHKYKKERWYGSVRPGPSEEDDVQVELAEMAEELPETYKQSIELTTCPE